MTIKHFKEGLRGGGRRLIPYNLIQHSAVSNTVQEWVTELRVQPWNNGKEVPRWGVAEIQKMSLLTTERCK